MDFLLLTCQLHFSGGVENPFSIYYIFHTAFAGLLLPRLSAALAAAWGILLFSGMVIGEGTDCFTHHGLSICHSEQFYRNPLALFAAIISLGSGMFFMTYLTASISRVIRKKEENESLLQKKVASRSQELVKVNRQLTHTMQMREQFLFTVEHELKAPLSAIISNLEAILATGNQLPHTMRSMISRSADRSRGLLALVQDLLILTRLEHEESSQCAELISISRILLDEIALIEPLIHNKNLHLETEIPPDITVFGYPDPLRYCITNLLSNAVKYTLRGTIKITLAIINDEVSLSVEDSGIGIPQDEQEKIFTDFYRTQEAKNAVSDGTGLGLSLVKRVMDQMYGRIELHSTPGRGSIFTLFFPKSFPS
jgi:signal transduction histidine kinase